MGLAYDVSDRILIMYKRELLVQYCFIIKYYEFNEMLINDDECRGVIIVLPNKIISE